MAINNINKNYNQSTNTVCLIAFALLLMHYRHYQKKIIFMIMMTNLEDVTSEMSEENAKYI